MEAIHVSCGAIAIKTCRYIDMKWTAQTMFFYSRGDDRSRGQTEIATTNSLGASYASAI